MEDATAPAAHGRMAGAAAAAPAARPYGGHGRRGLAHGLDGGRRGRRAYVATMDVAAVRS